MRELFDIGEIWNLFIKVFGHILYWTIMVASLLVPTYVSLTIGGLCWLSMLIGIPIFVALVWHLAKYAYNKIDY